MSSIKILDKGDYERAYFELEKFCINHTQLLVFGDFGDASFPSISDLDVFICLEDENFSVNRKKIIDYIKSDKIKEYLFFHDPLILPRCLFNITYNFHTMYGLKLTFLKDGIQINNSTKNNHFLNFIWSTYLMSIAPSFIHSNRYNMRDKLLVLKNICQSIDNFDLNAKSLNDSYITRVKAINNNLSNNELSVILSKKLTLLYNLDYKYFNQLDTTNSNNFFKIERNKIFNKSDNNSFDFVNKKIVINLNEKFFNLLSQFYYKKSNNLQINNYIEQSISTNNICKDLGISFPFIKPFNFEFYRDDIKFKLKKTILKL